MMDRLTRYVGNRAATIGDMGDLKDLRSAVDRLADYEDTGMTPDRIERLKDELEAAVNLIEEFMKEPTSVPICSYCKNWKLGNCSPCHPTWKGLED